MQTKPRIQAGPQSDALEQLKRRGNAACNELLEITLEFRNYADSLREYCRWHRGGSRKV